MKCFVACVCLLLLLATDRLFAQTPIPVRAFVFGNELGETVNDVTSDALGNTYYTGMFSGTIDFDAGPGTALLTSNGLLDNFIFKLNAAGQLVWARSFGGVSTEVASDLQLDAAGNIYIVGNFSDTVDFDPGPGVFDLKSKGGLFDAFLLKLDAGGGFKWAVAFGGTGGDVGSRVTTDAAGNVYAAGSFSETVNFDPGTATVNLTAKGSYDAFIVKLNSAGSYLWTGTVGGVEYDAANGLGVDAAGNMYLAGYITGEGDLDPGTGVHTAPGTETIGQGYIIKMNAAGNLQWAGTINTDLAAAINRLVVDAAGNILCLGEFEGTGDLNPGAGTMIGTSKGDKDIILLKLSSAGNLIWLKQFGGETRDFATTMSIDEFGFLYIAGTFSSTVDFDPGPGVANLSDDGYGSFVLKLDNDGNYLNVSQIRGGFTRSLVGLHAQRSTIYVTGNFSEYITFRDSTYTTEGLTPDAFIFTYVQPAALPLVLVVFDVDNVKGGAQLRWKTSAEVQVSGFIVERSTDGKHFNEIATVAAGKRVYDYFDPALSPGVYYYRLKMRDDDGSSRYSKVKMVIVSGGLAALKLYPIPARNFLHIDTRNVSIKTGLIQVRMYNTNGIKVKQLFVEAGSIYRLSVAGLRAGIYIVNLKARGVDVKRVITIE